MNAYDWVSKSEQKKRACFEGEDSLWILDQKTKKSHGMRTKIRHRNMMITDFILSILRSCKIKNILNMNQLLAQSPLSDSFKS